MARTNKEKIYHAFRCEKELTMARLCLCFFIDDKLIEEKLNKSILSCENKIKKERERLSEGIDQKEIYNIFEEAWGRKSKL